MAITTPFVRRLYPPSSPNKSEGDLDVIAIKRGTSRAGHWPWRTFDDEYTEEFSHSIAEFNRSVGLRPSQVYTETTHAKLVAAKAVKPNAGEPAFDVTARQLLRECHDRRTKSPEQAAAERMMDFCATFDGPYVWGGEHDSTTDDDNVHSGFDCSSSSSFALDHIGLLHTPHDQAQVSGFFKYWGVPNRGRFFTVHAASDHVWIEFTIPGRKWARFDTSPHRSGSRGPRLRYGMRDDGRFVHRHWPGH